MLNSKSPDIQSVSYFYGFRALADILRKHLHQCEKKDYALMLHAKSCMNISGTRRHSSEISQAQKANSTCSHSYVETEKIVFIVENTTVDPGGGGGGEREGG